MCKGHFLLSWWWMCGEYHFQTGRRKLIFSLTSSILIVLEKWFAPVNLCLNYSMKWELCMKMSVCAIEQMDRHTVPKYHQIPCIMVTKYWSTLWFVFFFKYCQMIHITAFCILSPRRKYEFNNHLHCVLCHIMTFFKYQLEEHYQYCYTGLYTRSHSDISLAFDISREETQDLAFISVLEDFARPRAWSELKGIMTEELCTC